MVAALLADCAPSEDVIAAGRALAAGFSDGSPNPLFFVIAACGIGVLASITKDAELAEIARKELALFPDGFNASFIFHGRHITGLISLEFGEVEAAIAEFEAAFEFMRFADHCPVPYALTAFDAARACRTRAGPGDPERGFALMDEALEIAQRLGMKPLIEKIIATREILKA